MAWLRKALLTVTLFGVMTSCQEEESVGSLQEGAEEDLLLPKAIVGLPQGIGSPELALLESINELTRNAFGLPLDIQNRVMLEFSIAVYWTIFWVGFISLAYAAVEGDKKTSGRAVGSSFWPDRTHALFGVTLLLGEATGRYECLNRLACLDQERAQDVLSLSNIFLMGAKALQPLFGHPEEDLDQMASEINQINAGMERALEYRRNGGICDAEYTCEEVPSL
ncbi:uncharacterized protein LOC143034921 [Oratosquilla oratoria]|uniref:uncharacterized protein LOC143034921 n=1 Tax=Oratosquilla oratoria TaxID=337810 RepID=UPI003F773FEB